MKKILIVNVAASVSGALSILDMYYKRSIENKNEEYIFVISTPFLEERSNIKIVRLPNIKKSWLHRIFFEKFTINKIIKKIKPDEIISLQNIYTGCMNITQTVYIHQSIPFSKHKFKLLKNFKLWIYQNIIGRLIKKSIKKADKVIVQTKYMKEACSKYTKEPNKIIIESPVVNKFKEVKCENNIRGKTSLFYPAAPQIYKNHMILLKALKIIKEEKKENIKLYLTLSKNQNKITKKLWRYSKKNYLDVEFIGVLNSNEMYEYYCNNILVFPSYIETVGLPLLEAQDLDRFIITTDESFSKEMVEGYEKKEYFKYDNINSLIKAIITVYNKNN